MGTNYPAALDTTTNQPVASALTGVELDGDGNANKVHSTLHGVHSEAVVAIEGKIGTGASTPIASRVLRGTGTGTSAWAQAVLTTDVTGTLPVANGGTGATALTNLITLGTHSTGNYLATLANATNGGTTIANSGSETAAATVAMNMNDLTAGVMADGDSIAFIDADDNATKKEALADLLDTIAGTVGTTGLDRSGATLVVTDLHPVGVSGSANQILTDDGDGTVTSESGLTFDSGALTLGDAGQVIFSDDAPASDHTATGVVLKMTALTGLALGEAVFIDSNGKLDEADADAVTSMPAIGVALEANSSGGDAEVKILIQGILRDDTYNFTPGADLFIGTTEGEITATAPSGSGDTVQKVGVALTADSVYLNFNTTEVLLA